MTVISGADQPTTDMRPVVFRLSEIVKTYGATTALRGVNLEVRAGEFVALLGPNGAGKSTLIKILDRVITQDSGTVEVAAEAGGLGVVHQDLGLVETLTVAENLFLGRSSNRWLHLAREAAATRAALAPVGLDGLDPHTLVESLSLGERTLIAVAKLLHEGSRVVVIDEVTAGLPPAEAEWLVRHLREAAHRGATVMMVTHRLAEVVGVAERYVLLLDGNVALDRPASTVGMDELVAMMSAGRAVVHDPAADLPPIEGERPLVCRLAAACSSSVGPIDLDLRAGEVVGVTGLVGSGLHDIAYLVAGLTKVTGGQVVVPKGIHRTCVPAHRETEGVFAEDTVEFNLTAGAWRRWRGPSGLLQVRKVRADAMAAVERLAVKTPDLEFNVGQLSGGNQQKTVLGRALIGNPQLLVLCEPTRGVDVATRREIYSQVRKVAQAGVAVLVVSSDIEDLAALAQRIAVVGVDRRIARWVDHVESTNLSLLAAELL